MELWERADLLGNPDAAMNLGVFYLQGLYPGKVADKVCAGSFSTGLGRKICLNAPTFVRIDCIYLGLVDKHQSGYKKRWKIFKNIILL